jgi:hypothetical protein
MKKGVASGLLLAASFSAFAQTKLDLGQQSKNIDFSQATSVRPFPTGAVLPATCSVGQAFFLTVAPLGANECIAANTWAPIQGGSGPVTANASGVITVQRISRTQLSIGSACSIATPCLFRIGSSVYSLLAPATATVTGGSGLATIYIDANANITVGVGDAGSLSASCAGCVVVSGITQYPLGIIPLETWNVTNGIWDATGTNNVAAMSVPPVLIGGADITVAQTGANITISYTGIDGANTQATPLGTFNPADPTQFYLNHLVLDSGYARGQDGWDYSGNCASGQGSGVVGFTQESIIPAVWGQASGTGNLCYFYFPADHGTSSYGAGSYDFWSGAAPSSLWLSGTYTTTDVNGTHFVGLSSSGNNAVDFIGCRQVGAGDWFAVIRAGGADVATADTGFPHDNSSHRLVVDNNSAVANTIRCSVDGGNTATATGTVPAEMYGWYFVMGAAANGADPTNFAAFQYIIFLQGLPRL